MEGPGLRKGWQDRGLISRSRKDADGDIVRCVETEAKGPLKTTLLMS